MFRVLVVEDEEIVRKGLMMTTDWVKYDMEIIGAASNGIEGIESSFKLNPDIIITDIKMPGMDGLEMMKKISKESNAVFIVISAFSEFEYAKEALQLGAIDYLLKPFTDDDLEVALMKAKEEVVKRSKMERYSKESRSVLFGRINRYLSTTDRSTHDNMLKTLDFIQEHYSEDLSVMTIADYLEVSESTVNRMFRSESTYSFNEYLTIFRIREACKLLSDPNIKIYEVASAVGYSDQRYFSSVFKKYVGVTPKHFKEQL